MQHTPRQIFAMVRAGLREEALRSNTPWYSVSCYYCTVRYPQEIHITDITYSLKRMAVREKLFDESKAPDFSQTFIAWAENLGRSFKLGLMGIHMVRRNPFGAFKIVDFGLGLVTEGRMAFMPTRIKGIEGHKRISVKAKELEVGA